MHFDSDTYNKLFPRKEVPAGPAPSVETFKPTPEPTPAVPVSTIEEGSDPGEGHEEGGE